MNHRRAKDALPAIVTSALLASGCFSGAFDSDVPQRGVYVITAQAPTPSEAAPLAVDLIVARPSARPGLDTDRIAVLNADRRLDYYAGGRWGAEADVVVQDLLVESLRNTGRLRTVQGDVSAFSADYVLQSELNDFQAEYSAGSGDPVVRVTLECTLGRVKDRRSLSVFTATATAPAADNTLGAVVAAFESAYRQAATTAVNETLTALSAATAPPASADSGN
jgi:cholesterol transport system auxiliary component